MHYHSLPLMRKLLAGQTPARILMNYGFAKHTLSGRVVDIGGGHSPDYYQYFSQASGTTLEIIDGSLSGIDFEKDALPFADGSVDTVILANVLEHLYKSDILLKEIHRILSKDGKLIGFVPFWVGYHPDPHDYFRYTKEALMRMFADALFVSVNIETVGGGPFLANLNTIILSVPRILRPIFAIPYVILDKLFIFLRPRSLERNPLGYIFVATPHA